MNAALMNQDSHLADELNKTFAPLYLLSNSERTKDYHGMAAELIKIQKAGDKISRVVQPPAYWHTNEDGSLSGHSISYRWTEDDGMVADVIKETYRLGADGTMIDDPVTENVSSEPLAISPQRLLSIDLIHGTGDEREIMNRGGAGGETIIPAIYRGLGPSKN
jgi:hypothetical protein